MIMAHNKHGRPKNSRAGCLMCKPWKMNGISTNSKEGESFSDRKRRPSASEEIRNRSEQE